ncbi:MAG: hypothetical protein JEZ11_26780 [Desulfobacterales bacterium]|nr:hypothetical protein [Desulfobacterales bacterium]
MTAETITCPKCGHDNAGDAQDCAKCGITFEIYAEVKEESAKLEQKMRNKKVETPKDMAICPKCSHANNPLSLDCLKCGIVFSKFFESMEMELEGDPSQADTLQRLRIARDEMDALRKRKEEEAQQETLRKQQEEKARIETLKKERQQELHRQEELKRQQEEAERQRQEELKRQQKEKQRLEEIERQKAEEERKRQEELKRQQEEAEAERQRLEEIEQQKAEEERKCQEELKRQQEEAERHRQEEIERQKAEEEQNRREELEKQQAAEEAEQETLHQEREVQEKTEAQRRERLADLMKPKGSIKKLLKNYADQVVGMNYDAPNAYKPVRLIGINDDHFSILVEADELVYTFPMGSILAMVEGVDGVRTAAGREKAVYPLVIRVSQRVM